MSPLKICLLYIALCVGLALGKPKLSMLDKASVSFGTYPNIEDRVVEISVRNDGDSELAIKRIRATCKCMRVDSYPKSVPPGETGKVKVTLKKNELVGQYKRIFYIESNDPINKRIRVVVTGNAKPLFDVKCDRKNQLGVITCGQVWTGKYSIVANYPDLSLGQPSVIGEGSKSEFSIVTNNQEECSYEVTRIINFEDAGRLTSSLLFPVHRSDGEELPHLRLYASAITKAPIRVVPKKLIVSDVNKSIEKRLMVSINDGNNPVDDSLIKCSSEISGLSSRISKCRIQNACYVYITLTPDYLKKLDENGDDSIVISYAGKYSHNFPIEVAN